MQSGLALLANPGHEITAEQLEAVNRLLGREVAQITWREAPEGEGVELFAMVAFRQALDHFARRIAHRETPQ